MRRQLYPALFSAIILASACQAQTYDVPPKGRPNERAVQGGSYPVPIDSTTPLPDLVQRLTGPWTLVHTGKAYWIGYTNDMYSIAAHKEAAIPQVVELVRNTKDKHAKFGGLYTLHLIGINSTIIGRFNETFTNKAARQALLSFVEDPTCGTLAMSLLMRDPWQSDIPQLVAALKNAGGTRPDLISALFRYTEGKSPFRQDIAPEWNNIEIVYKDRQGSYPLGNLQLVKREKKDDNPEVINAIIGKENIVIQWGPEGRIVRELVTNDHNQQIKARLGTDEPERALYDLILLSKDKVSVFSYSDFEETVWHVVEPHRIVIVPAEVAAQMWLAYFKAPKP